MISPKMLDVAAKLLELILDIVGQETAQALLTEAARRRQNAIADQAEAAKFRTP